MKLKLAPFHMFRVHNYADSWVFSRLCIGWRLLVAGLAGSDNPFFYLLHAGHTLIPGQ